MQRKKDCSWCITSVSIVKWVGWGHLEGLKMKTSMTDSADTSHCIVTEWNKIHNMPYSDYPDYTSNKSN